MKLLLMTLTDRYVTVKTVECRAWAERLAVTRYHRAIVEAAVGVTADGIGVHVRPLVRVCGSSRIILGE